jgi:hypothetical protein
LLLLILPLLASTGCRGLFSHPAYRVKVQVAEGTFRINEGATLRIDVVPVRRSEITELTSLTAEDWFHPPKSLRKAWLDRMGQWKVEERKATELGTRLEQPYPSSDPEQDYAAIVVFADFEGACGEPERTRLVFTDDELGNQGWQATILVHEGQIAKPMPRS